MNTDKYTLLICYRKETGEDSYLICEGGSDLVGFYGYLSAFQELVEQVIYCYEFVS